MMCCAIAALFVAMFAALRGAAKRAAMFLPRARWISASLAAALVLTGGSALMARELYHAPREDDLSQFLMQHICGSQGDEAAVSPGRGNTKR